MARFPPRQWDNRKARHRVCCLSSPLPPPDGQTDFLLEGSRSQSWSPVVTEVASLQVGTPSCVFPDSSPVTPSVRSLSSLLTAVRHLPAGLAGLWSGLCWTSSIHTGPAVQWRLAASSREGSTAQDVTLITEATFSGRTDSFWNPRPQRLLT